MHSELIKLYEENPDRRKMEHIVEVVRNGGLIICPTDTIYALCCDIFNNKALDKLKRLKGEKGKEMNFSFICHDLSNISEYAKVDTPTFKLMKKTLPGPYTYILQASSKVPKILNARKKTIGIRVPENKIARNIVHMLGNPIMTTSIPEEQIQGHSTDPEVIHEEFKNRVDLVIDGGYGDVVPSTIIDCTDEEPIIIREGKGDTSFL